MELRNYIGGGAVRCAEQKGFFTPQQFCDYFSDDCKAMNRGRRAKKRTEEVEDEIGQAERKWT